MKIVQKLTTLSTIFTTNFQKFTILAQFFKNQLFSVPFQKFPILEQFSKIFSTIFKISLQFF